MFHVIWFNTQRMQSRIRNTVIDSSDRFYSLNSTKFAFAVTSIELSRASHGIGYLQINLTWIFKWPQIQRIDKAHTIFRWDLDNHLFDPFWGINNNRIHFSRSKLVARRSGDPIKVARNSCESSRCVLTSTTSSRVKETQWSDQRICPTFVDNKRRTTISIAGALTWIETLCANDRRRNQLLIVPVWTQTSPIGNDPSFGEHEDVTFRAS